MSPKSTLSVAPSGPDEEFQVSFRRGRMHVLLLAVLSGGYFGAESLRGFLTGESSGGLASLFISWALVGWVCWCVFQGGPLAGGCLLVMAIPFLLAILLGMVTVAINTVGPIGHLSMGVGRFHEIGSDWKGTLSFLPSGAWAAYVFWVLRISKDARLYREARRQGIAESERNAFKWPPVGRRP